MNGKRVFSDKNGDVKLLPYQSSSQEIAAAVGVNTPVKAQCVSASNPLVTAFTQRKRCIPHIGYATDYYSLHLNIQLPQHVFVCALYPGLWNPAAEWIVGLSHVTIIENTHEFI